MKEIELTRGKVSLVDDNDYGWLSQNKWQFDRYAYRTIKVGKKKRSVRMHREIMKPPKGMVVDHINGNKTDNRRENLRVVTQSDNGINRHCGKRAGSSSKYFGVFWDNTKSKWRAMVRKEIIGRYPTEEEAAIAYNHYIVERRILAPLNEEVIKDAEMPCVSQNDER